MIRRLTLLVTLAAMVSAIFAATAPAIALAATPYQDIASAGPLEHVYLGNDLSCQVAHTADTSLEFYHPSEIPGDCGTFVAVGDALFAPDFSDQTTATAGLGAYTAFTPVSQSAITGTGTAASPFQVITVADVGTTGLRIQQTDSYVIGDEAYRTSIVVSNTGQQAVSGILYRAGDCFLGGSDNGYGFTEVFGTRKAVGCSVNADNSPAGRIEEWVPLTGGNNFYQSFYGSVWSWIGGTTSFPDTCDCATLQDNGAGISWSFAVAGGGSLTYAHATTFSPTGKQALETSKTADAASSTAGATNGYTITISNANPDAVTLDSITDNLPAGFSYVAGSTTGVTTSDPSIAGQTLTWNGPHSVAANGSATVHFSVTVASTPGTYHNEAGGTAADGYTLIPSGPTAPITVVAGAKSTSTTYDGAAGVQYSDAASLSATLLDTSSSPSTGIAGKQLDFTLGTQSATAGPTDASGQAATGLIVTQQPGSVVSVQSAFAGDATYLASADSDPFAIAKEDCTIAYTGDTLVNASSMTTLSAQFGELDASPGSWSGKTVTFTLTDASLAVTTYTAVTNAAGFASTTAALGPSVYAVGVSFAGDDFYLACASAEDTLVTVAAATAKITGGGWFSQATGRTNFGFNVIQDVTGLHGQLQVRTRTDKGKFHSTSVLTLNATADAGTWTGTGRWNGVDGYTFTVSVVDNGTSGKKGDTLSIVIKSPTNITVFTTGGPQPLKGGNIVVH